MRVGFLFNHDQVHQVAHGLPTAIALSRRRGVSVEILTGSARMTREVDRLLHGVGARLPVRELALGSAPSRIAARVLNRLVPATKLALYRDNLDAFRALDVLVVAEKTSTMLRTRYGLDDLRIVHTRHGAGDRAIGFDGASGRFDHVLVAGEAIRERLVRQAGIPPSDLSVVGYPKFDLLPENPEPLPMQANGRPTVLYNPHVAPHLSSWYRCGRDILDYFASSTEYNLIFAPHVMLFHRPLAVTVDPLRLHFPGGVPRRIRTAPNIHVDVSSPACTDMTYTMAADVYLGDASSQVYEFLKRPRPCIFFDAHGVGDTDDESFAHWRAGRVVRSIAEMDAALGEAVARPKLFEQAQRSMFSSHIDLTGERSSERAARAIERFMCPTSQTAPVAATDPDGSPCAPAASPGVRQDPQGPSIAARAAS